MKAGEDGSASDDADTVSLDEVRSRMETESNSGRLVENGVIS